VLQLKRAFPPHRFEAAWILLITSLIFTQALGNSQPPGSGEQAGETRGTPEEEEPGSDVKRHAWPAYVELDHFYAGIRPLLQQELTTREISEPADLYKFLFQSVMGPAHAGIDPDHAQAWLQNEWEEMSAAEPEISPRIPLLEPLRPDNKLVRLHLRPLVNLVTAEVPVTERDQVISLAWERLASVFSRTAESWPTELGLLRGLWERVVIDHDLWREHFSSVALNRFTQEVSDAQWPAVHHSDTYRERWQPHYRVVSPFLLPPAWLEELRGRDNEGESR